MANYYKHNVIHVDTSGYTLSGQVRINAVKYIAGTTSSFNIRANAASDGPILYTVDGDADNYEEGLNIRAKNGIYVEAGASDAELYIYLH